MPLDSKKIKLSTKRFLFFFLASLIPAACLIGVCLSGCNKGAVVAFMIIATLFYGSMFAGVVSNHVDIASNYAGLFMLTIPSKEQFKVRFRFMKMYLYFNKYKVIYKD